MAYIYTISHPFTNQIFYVGATNNLKRRSLAHAYTTTKNHAVSLYIQNLKEQYILPKIEVLDECKEEDLFEVETYWISQITAWGFELLNRNKIPRPSVRANYYQRIDILSKGGKYNYNLAVDGFTTKVENRHRFDAGFRFYKKIRGLNLYPHYYSSNGELYCTFKTFKKPIKEPRIKKIRIIKERVKPEPKLIRFNFKETIVGSCLSIPLEKYDSFKNSLRGYLQRNNDNMIFTYIKQNNLVTATRIA